MDDRDISGGVTSIMVNYIPFQEDGDQGQLVITQMIQMSPPSPSILQVMAAEIFYQKLFLTVYQSLHYLILLASMAQSYRSQR